MPVVKTFFHFNPTQETLIAFISAVLMVPVYYYGTHHGDTVANFIVFILFGNLFLNVLFPAFYITFIKKSTLHDLGITPNFLKTSLFISFLLALSSLPQLIDISSTVSDDVLLHHIIFNLISLWEPFFVFGWLLLCFDRAFGSVFGIILATLCLLAYHIGSYPLSAMLGLGVGIFVIGVLFLLTKNLLLVWPLGWGISASIGTLQGHISFTWDDIITYLIILIIQIGFIIYCARICNQSSESTGAT